MFSMLLKMQKSYKSAVKLGIAMKCAIKTTFIIFISQLAFTDCKLHLITMVVNTAVLRLLKFSASHESMIMSLLKSLPLTYNFMKASSRRYK